MKKYLVPFAGFFLALFGIDAFAVTPTSLTDVAVAIDTTDIKTSLYTVFGTLSTVAILILGGSLVLTKLGLRR